MRTSNLQVDGEWWCMIVRLSQTMMWLAIYPIKSLLYILPVLLYPDDYWQNHHYSSVLPSFNPIHLPCLVVSPWYHALVSTHVGHTCPPHDTTLLLLRAAVSTERQQPLSFARLQTWGRPTIFEQTQTSYRFYIPMHATYFHMYRF